jgi:hypothetical protein
MNGGKGFSLSRRNLLKSAAIAGAGAGLKGVSGRQPVAAAPLAVPGTPARTLGVSYEPMIGVPFSSLETGRVGIGFYGGTKLAVPWPGEAHGTANATDNCVQRKSGVSLRSGRRPIMEIPVVGFLG